MDWCDVCKYNPPDYSSHEPDKPCGDCWVFGEGNEPSKFVETENRKTNAGRIRGMSDEELAEFMIGVLCYTKLPYMEVREKALRDNELLDWLREEAKDD